MEGKRSSKQLPVQQHTYCPALFEELGMKSSWFLSLNLECLQEPCWSITMDQLIKFGFSLLPCVVLFFKCIVLSRDLEQTGSKRSLSMPACDLVTKWRVKSSYSDDIVKDTTYQLTTCFSYHYVIFPNKSYIFTEYIL